jgi:two-component system OmpR family response regulator
MARVMIVDDTEIVRAAITRAVRELGHVPVSMPDVLEALALAQKQPPELALLDFQMPRVDGATFFAELREVLGDRCPKIIMISAAPREEIEAALDPDCRPVAFVKKPFTLEELERIVQEALAPPATAH